MSDTENDGLKYQDGYSVIINGYGVFGKDRQAVERLMAEARLDELKRLKKIDCFNKAYSSDPRPSKHIDIRIAELEGKWKVMDASDDIPYGDPEK